MARIKVTALDVNASGITAIHVGGDITCNEVIVGNNISSSTASIDILDDVDMTDNSLFNATGESQDKGKNINR